MSAIANQGMLPLPAPRKILRGICNGPIAVASPAGGVFFLKGSAPRHRAIRWYAAYFGRRPLSHHQRRIPSNTACPTTSASLAIRNVFTDSSPGGAIRRAAEPVISFRSPRVVGLSDTRRDE